MTTDVVARLRQSLSDRYRIERELGAGGMATVYLAHDLRHDRPVAVKVLKPELAAVLGAERFVVEIKTTASLQHPHILPLFDSGSADGFLFYVMPFIEGETLRDKLNRERQLGVDEAIRITTEVADALDYAHRHGVIHRDIKPENILLHDGRPMVADFGIALAVSAAAGGRMTETGLSLGTPHYMSPEQATAEKDITGRSDIYSLASVLYEMLTGQPPHVGGTAQQVIMRIIADTPRDVSELRRAVPPHVAAAVAQALEKLPADRFASAKVFAEALKNPAFPVATSMRRTVASTGGTAWIRDPRSLGAVAAIVALGGYAAVKAIGGARPGAEAGAGITRFVLSIPGGLVQHSGECDQVALSPDGTSLAYVASGKLWVRRLDSWEPKALDGTDGAATPLFSADGRSIAFADQQALRRIPVEGGAPAAIAGPVVISGCTDAWWGDDGAIAFRPAAARELALLPANSTTPQILTRTPASARAEYHVWPQLVDGGRQVLFTTLGVSGLWNDTRIVLEDLTSRERTVVAERGTYGRYVTTGHVLYADASGTVMALPYDVRKRTATGEAFPVAAGVRVGTWGGASASYAVSLNGETAAFAFGSNAGRIALWWADRSGKLLGQVGEPMAGGVPLDLSPDGRWAATVIVQQNNADVWLIDTQTGERRRFTTAPGYDWTPVWSPDGKRLAYPVTTDSGIELHVQNVASDSAPVPLYRTDSDLSVRSWSRDGWILMHEGRGQTDVRALQIDRPKDVISVVATPASERDPALSPDGRWLAYSSDESGTPEIYVMAFPGKGRPQQISIKGGLTPRWSRRGDELYYLTPDHTLMTVRTRQGAEFDHAAPVALFKLPDVESSWSYVPAPDGQRFLLGRLTASASIPELHVVRNFDALLRARGKP